MAFPPITDIAALPQPALMSLDDLMASDSRIEIMDGKVIEMSDAGIIHHRYIRNIMELLLEYVKTNDIGEVFSDGLTYMMFSNARGLKDSFMPDVSLILKQNFLPMNDLSKPYPGVPDLAVEVVSPDDKPGKLARKVRVYLEKGTSQVWMVYPEVNEVHQYRRDTPDTARIYTGAQSVDVSPLLPGLMLPLESIFKLPGWLAAQHKPDESEE